MVKSAKRISKTNKKFSVNGRLWIECDKKRFLGPGRLELLELIEETGSINKAAKEMSMSYKKAWEMIAILNEYSATPLVVTQAGGAHGGGSTLTDEAQKLITYYRHLHAKFKTFLEKETIKYNKQ